MMIRMLSYLITESQGHTKQCFGVMLSQWQKLYKTLKYIIQNYNLTLMD